MIPYRMGSLRGFRDASYAAKAVKVSFYVRKRNKLAKLHIKVLKLFTSLSLINYD